MGCDNTVQCTIVHSTIKIETGLNLRLYNRAYIPLRNADRSIPVVEDDTVFKVFKNTAHDNLTEKTICRKEGTW